MQLPELGQRRIGHMLRRVPPGTRPPHSRRARTDRRGWFRRTRTGRSPSTPCTRPRASRPGIPGMTVAVTIYIPKVGLVGYQLFEEFALAFDDSSHNKNGQWHLPAAVHLPNLPKLWHAFVSRLDGRGKGYVHHDSFCAYSPNSFTKTCKSSRRPPPGLRR